ncbi:MAG: hypothetical protein QNJ12_08885 [Ilumatobacter sp.]|uniref:hypothetical protein n=1 Tax=Ilumatobacter sp. TaxID=1967498 RepID=UPI00260DD202|nr:hypothetical protein [Ilumatobacter sp.]MDJ0768896.1 hypothetical protein [Ilumatobacter sp.]
MNDELDDRADDRTYPGWLADYRLRRQGLHLEINAIGQEMLEIDRHAGMQGNWCTDAARRFAAERRDRLQHPFCLLLWSQRFDEDFFLEVTHDLDVDLEHARGLLTHKAGNFLPRVGRLTCSLDVDGFYLLMLWPEGRSDPPEQPLVWEVPEEDMPADGVSPARKMNMWFYVFSAAVELAQAIIVEGNYSRVLYQELAGIEQRGLGQRILAFDNNDDLYRHDDDRRWSLASAGDAVRFAAAQPVRSPG